MNEIFSRNAFKMFRQGESAHDPTVSIKYFIVILKPEVWIEFETNLLMTFCGMPVPLSIMHCIGDWELSM